MIASVVVSVAESSGVAAARRAAMALADAQKLGASDVGRVGLVTTEAASNLVKHAGGGEVLLRPIDHSGGVEVLAIDRGRGMVDVTACTRDGYTTAGSPGTGLGAISRMANLLDVYSAEGTGTVLMAQVRARGERSASVEVGAVCVAHPGEIECGDGWTMRERGGITTILVADGLGHGALAHAAARAAIETFHGQPPDDEPATIVETLHDALRSTRGAAIAVARLDPLRGIVRFCGAGNVQGAILGAGSERRMISHNGTAGHQIRRIQEFSYPWPEDAIVVLHTDGVTSHWDLTRHPGLLAARHPAVVAGVIYRDFRRTRDDATVVVLRRATTEVRSL